MKRRFWCGVYTVGSPWEALMTKPLERDAIYLKRCDAQILDQADVGASEYS